MDRSYKPYEIIRYQQVESTSTIAMKLASSGAESGTVVHALEQTGGKGRQSRSFCSPPGGLYASLILRTSLNNGELPLITLASGVAAAEAVEEVTHRYVQLKWPNDLYIHHRKLGGILTESAPYSNESRSIPFVVVGIGLNVNTPVSDFPEPLQGLIISLKSLTGKEHELDDLVRVLAEKTLTAVDLLQNNRETLFDKWRERDYLLHKQLSWKAPDGKILSGSGRGLMGDGRYRLTSSDGVDCPVLSGDIILTQVNGQYIK